MPLADEVRARFEIQIRELLAEWGAALGGGNVKAEADDEYWWTVDLAEGAAYARLTLADAAIRDDPSRTGIAVLVKVVSDEDGEVLGILAPDNTLGAWAQDIAGVERQLAAAATISTEQPRTLLLQR